MTAMPTSHSDKDDVVMMSGGAHPPPVFEGAKKDN